MELETHLIIAHHLKYLGDEPLKLLQAEIENTGKMLNRLIQAPRNRWSLSRTPKP